MFKIDLPKLLKSEFEPKYFNNSEIEKLMKENEDKVLLTLRTPENDKSYSSFDNDFSTYLDKLPNSPLKTAVSFLFNKKMVFIGAHKTKDVTTISRVLLTKNEKLAGVVLNSYALDISLSTGSCPQIDECINGAYLGIIRGAIISNKQEVKKDVELHKLITSFLFLLILKIIGRQISVLSLQKQLLHLICIYLFYKQYLEEKHLKIIHLIEKNYVGDLITKEDYESFKSYLDKMQPFTSFKDIPRIVNDFNLSQTSPQQLTMQIIKIVSKNGFYALIGSLDNLIASAIISKYPTELISRGFNANSEIQDKLETKVEKYINKLKYDDEFSNVVSKEKK